MNFIFPMGGRSSRFANAGYTVPKYQLDLHGRTVFEHSVIGFHRYFADHIFVFAFRGGAKTADFVSERCHSLGIPAANIRLVHLKQLTSGQAETVHIAIEGAGLDEDEPITIFNIDSFQSDFQFPTEFNIRNVDGYLEVFIASGNHWSFIEPGENGRVLRVTEKDRISDYCSSGLYFFRTTRDFRVGYLATYGGSTVKSALTETYIAPIYNALISRGADIRYCLIDHGKLAFSGVPDEYRRLKTQADLPTVQLLEKLSANKRNLG